MFVAICGNNNNNNNFNDRILRYIARFKLEGMSSKDYLRITEEQLQEVIDQQLSLESIRSADKRSIEDIAKKELVWDLKIPSSEGRVHNLFAAFGNFMDEYEGDAYFALEGNQKKQGLILIDALKPPALKLLVERAVDLVGKTALRDPAIMEQTILAETTAFDKVDRAMDDIRRLLSSKNGTGEKTTSRADDVKKKHDDHSTSTTTTVKFTGTCAACNKNGHKFKDCRITPDKEKKELAAKFAEDRKSKEGSSQAK